MSSLLGFLRAVVMVVVLCDAADLDAGDLLSHIQLRACVKD